jgi:Sec-independent protein translocase protein TatA
MLGTTEIIIIIAVFGVLLFGPAFLKKTGTAAAETIREFRKVKDELAQADIKPPVKK